MKNFLFFFLLTTGIYAGAAVESISPKMAADFAPAGLKDQSDGSLLMDKSAYYRTRQRLTVDPKKKYRLSCDLKLEGNEPVRVILCVCPEMKDGRPILGWNIYAIPGTETELTADVRKGDRFIEVKSTPKLEQLERVSIYRVVFNSDKTGKQNDLPNFEVSDFIKNKVLDIQKGVIKLELPKPLQKAYPQGTGVRLHQDHYPWGPGIIHYTLKGTEWTKIEKIIESMPALPMKAHPVNTLWPGTSRLGIMIFPWPMKPLPEGSGVRIRNVELSELSEDAFKGSFRLELDRPDGIYKVGETVRCTVRLIENGKPVPKFKVDYTAAFEKQQIAMDTLESQEGIIVVNQKASRPGWLYFRFRLSSVNGKALDGKVIGEAGAMFDPGKIAAAAKPPADFHAYWEKCRAELNKIPVTAKLKPVELPLKFKDKVDCWAVTVDCSSREPVTGYLAVPKKSAGKKLPAYVNFLSHMEADTSKERAAATAMRGVIAFYVTWHGLPVNQPKSFYTNKFRSKEYKGYFFQGVTNRDTWYFHDMFMRVMRALDYIKTRPEWNGKDLVVQGGSLGGAQTIAAAALDPAVTLAVVAVPAFCDLNGSKAGRENGFPFRGQQGKALLESDDRIPQVASYFEAGNFAGLIRCPIFVCTGFIDNICPPSNVFTFYNAIPSTVQKHMTTNPFTGHFGTTRDPAAEERLEKFFKED
ncbi:MAG: acetylxylan esterase [Victivallales bacterium]|nr:acetylxylan esterase [Victivallales bacterium]